MRGRPTGSARLLLAVAGGSLLLAGCGGGDRQDKGEPSATYKVDVSSVSFPKKQTLAEKSVLRIVVRNADTRPIPNVAVSIGGPAGAPPAAAFGFADSTPGLADPSRPIWIIDQGPTGGDTAYVNTWSLGRELRPGSSATFLWHVTAVRAGSQTVTYRVAGGLAGKAKAELAGGGKPDGSLTVDIARKAPQAYVNDAGRVVKKGYDPTKP